MQWIRCSTKSVALLRSQDRIPLRTEGFGLAGITTLIFERQIRLDDLDTRHTFVFSRSSRVYRWIGGEGDKKRSCKPNCQLVWRMIDRGGKNPDISSGGSRVQPQSIAITGGSESREGRTMGYIPYISSCIWMYWCCLMYRYDLKVVKNLASTSEGRCGWVDCARRVDVCRLLCEVEKFLVTPRLGLTEDRETRVRFFTLTAYGSLSARRLTSRCLCRGRLGT